MIKEDKGVYDKKFVYLDYLERGKKIKNGGFYKWEVKGDTCRIMIHVRGLYPTDTIYGEILLVSGGLTYPADHISLHLGCGEYLAVWNTGSLAGTEVCVDKCDGLIIKLSENRLLKGLWNQVSYDVNADTTTVKSDQQTKNIPTGMGQEEKSGNEIPSIATEENEKNIPEKKEELIEQEIVINEVVPDMNNEQSLVIERIPVMEHAQLSDQIQPEKVKQSQQRDVPVVEKPLSLSGDKWQQLKNQFITITPFQDGKEYLSITPRDFVILPCKYQSLVQNSFLLHGYYNYGHVVLAREKDRMEEKYYLGVPGVYYDREKQAALMFGFEGFEGGSAKTPDGGFGYYMMRVEI